MNRREFLRLGGAGLAGAALLGSGTLAGCGGGSSGSGGGLTVASWDRDLERFAGGPVRTLAWREGTPLGADGRADGALRDAGYELLLANHAVQRIR